MAWKPFQYIIEAARWATQEATGAPSEDIPDITPDNDLPSPNGDGEPSPDIDFPSIDWKPGDIIGGIQQWFTDILEGVTGGISGGIADIGAGFKGISTGIGEGLEAGGEQLKPIITFAVPVLIVVAIAGMYLKFK